MKPSLPGSQKVSTAPALDKPQPSSNPNFPWLGQRGTIKDLASFGVSPEEFFGGGGKLMFGEKAPSPAQGVSPQIPAVPSAQLLKTPAKQPMTPVRKPMKAALPVKAGGLFQGMSLDDIPDLGLAGNEFKVVGGHKIVPQAPPPAPQGMPSRQSILAPATPGVADGKALSPLKAFKAAQLKMAVATNMASPYDQARNSVGTENWQARIDSGVPGFTSQETQKMDDSFRPDLAAQRNSFQQRQEEAQRQQQAAHARSPEGRVQTMARNNYVDSIAAQARQMTEANNAAKAQGQALPYNGQEYRGTYEAGSFPPHPGVSAYVPPPQPVASAAQPTPMNTPVGGGFKPVQPSNPFNAPRSLNIQQSMSPAGGGGNVNIPANITSTPKRQKTPGINPTGGSVFGSNNGVKSLGSSMEATASLDDDSLQRAWTGFESELKKQGANEDFILGLHKEAEDSAALAGVPVMEKLKEILKGSQAPDVTGSAANRHHIIPGVANKWLGMAGGAGLGAMMGGELGTQGMMGMALPALGAAAGHHYLPELMNKWKDAYGTGVNRVNPGVAALNRMNSINIPGAD